MASLELPPANELFANQEKYETYMYQMCSACRKHVYYTNCKNVVGLCWLCFSCYHEMRRSLLMHEQVDGDFETFKRVVRDAY